MIYLDHAATTPISENAVNTWIKANDSFFANTSSLHEPGEVANQLLTTCQRQLATLLDCQSDEIYFTSGGTESNHLALESLYLANKHKGNHVITSSIEHPSVHSFFHQLEEKGVEVTYLPVDHHGLIDIEEVKKATRNDTFLASIQHVNAEIGTIQPLAQLGDWFKECAIIFHSDCVQSFGKIPINTPAFSVDAISISSHKIYGPKGVGAVFLSNKVNWSKIRPLTSHQQGFRPGTLNIPGIASFTQASVDIHEQLEDRRIQAWSLREGFISAIAPLGDKLRIEGHPLKSNQLPWIIGISIKGIQGQYMMLSLDRHNICISTGSACQSEEFDASSAMNSIYLSEQDRLRFFRISFGKHTTKQDLSITATKILEISKE
ncbi:IscS subfamily cysteine desulfurase [Salipaludibacillus sp. CF4.18]|uniref:IscS subfamily cysteine desulfurase n=1 Tax=Salipaludibacillus sp. CF4.18 TaxID=3373081 RepID=UPI003EE5DD79